MNHQHDQIYKIGAIILDAGRLLVVRKKGADRSEYIIPGGKPEGSEEPKQTLVRELQEELQVGVMSISYFATFRETAIFERVPMTMAVYVTEVVGTPVAAAEIDDIQWIDRYYAKSGIALGTVLSRHVIPALVHRGQM